MNLPRYKNILLLPAVLLTSVFHSGCRTHQPLPHPDYVNLSQFMGIWYVQGYTPIVVDKQAFNASESYELIGGRIETTYRFNKGSFEGPEKVFTPVATVYDEETNAEWRMQFIWPFKSKYHILHVDEHYQEALIVHPNRKYAWIMSRSRTMDDATYQAHIDRLKKEGFDIPRIQRVLHQLPEA